MAAHEIYEPSSESVVDDLHRMRSRVLEQNSHDDDDDDDDYDDTNRTKRLKSVVVVKVNYTNSSKTIKIKTSLFKASPIFY